MTTKKVQTQNFASQRPALRFPDFLNDGEWRFVHGNELFEPIVNKNHNSELPVLAITQDQGAVPRDMIDYKVIVSEKSVAGYKVVEVGDFIISLRSFQGGIENSNYKGLCSPAYIILRKKDDSICNDFYRYYFKSSRFIKDLNRNLEGIRDGKMISYQQFSEIMLPFPPLAEQRRIAQALTALDELIAATNEKLEQMKAYKKGLMQRMFTTCRDAKFCVSTNRIPKLRFPEFYEEKEWEEKKLGECFSERTERNYNDLPLLSLTESDGIVLQEETNRKNNSNADKSRYLRICVGDIAYNTMRMWQGRCAIVNIEGIVSPAYTICKPKQEMDSLFFYYYFKTNDAIDKFHRNSQGLVNDTLNLKYESFEKIKMYVPSLPEQRKIASCLSAMDETINAYTEKVGLLGQYKKGLMQRMFPQNQMN